MDLHISIPRTPRKREELQKFLEEKVRSSEFVTKDEGNTIWSYIEGKYYRFDDNGNLISKISSDSIPDPYKMWQDRAALWGYAPPAETATHPQSGREIRLKPSAATFALFEHREAVRAQSNE